MADPLVTKRVSDTKERVHKLLIMARTARDRKEPLTAEQTAKLCDELNRAEQDLQSAQTLLIHQ